MIILADYNLNRQAILLSGSLLNGGWLDLLSIKILTFANLGLSSDLSDRLVWQFVQTKGMMLITANRNAKGEDSLEKVMREENTPNCLPIITIGSSERVNEFDYRERCIERLIDVVIDVEYYKGAGRIFIP